MELEAGRRLPARSANHQVGHGLMQGRGVVAGVTPDTEPDVAGLCSAGADPLSG